MRNFNFYRNCYVYILNGWDDSNCLSFCFCDSEMLFGGNCDCGCIRGESDQDRADVALRCRRASSLTSLSPDARALSHVAARIDNDVRRRLLHSRLRPGQGGQGRRLQPRCPRRLGERSRPPRDALRPTVIVDITLIVTLFHSLTSPVGPPMRRSAPRSPRLASPPSSGRVRSA